MTKRIRKFRIIGVCAPDLCFVAFTKFAPPFTTSGYWCWLCQGIWSAMPDLQTIVQHDNGEKQFEGSLLESFRVVSGLENCAILIHE